METTKMCKACGQELALSQFRRQSGTKDGLQYECKACMSLRNKERYSQKRDLILSANLAWQKENKPKHNVSAKKYYYSPTGRLHRALNKRLDELLSKARFSFSDIIGVSPAALIVHLTACLSGRWLVEEYQDKWLVGFDKKPSEEQFADKDALVTFLNWKNL